ncbi:MAG: RNA polymerase sigma-70 factor [Tannerellaceae bacterium]|jgi:RNA polymerase sigma-70 factor (ECF subfamily)|nr:RNA polymerase sigma-70 factor [Tannerellaceae bacterium]
MKHITLENKTDFEQLYLCYYPKLVRFTREYVISVEDAENIVQDVFLVLWEQKDSLMYVQDVPSFLFRLTKNKCVDFLRHKIMSAEKNQCLRDTQIREYEYRLRSMEQFEDNRFEEEEVSKLIHNAIQSLPEKCKEIFLLSRFEGMSHQEIARKYNISQSTVNNQISVAMKKLKEQLRKYLSDNIF